MTPFLVLLLLIVLLGGFGFAAHFLWIVLVAALVLWVIGFFAAGAPVAGGRRGWYRW